MRYSLLIFFSFLPFLVVREVEGQCCPLDPMSGKCGDGSSPTPCCGKRTCNFICCSCSGGCRATDGFTLIDQDGDEGVSLVEAKAYVLKGFCGTNTGGQRNDSVFEKEFQLLDTNRDGSLSREEIGAIHQEEDGLMSNIVEGTEGAERKGDEFGSIIFLNYIRMTPDGGSGRRRVMAASKQRKALKRIQDEGGVGNEIRIAVPKYYNRNDD